MTKTFAAVFVTVYFLIKAANGVAGIQTITFDVEDMG